jgi:hypothetical protein
MSNIGPIKEKPCEITKTVLKRVLQYLDEGDVAVSGDTLDYLDSELKSAGMADFVQEPRAFVRNIVGALSDRTSTIASVPKFSTIPNCEVSFSSQIYIIQQLVLQSAKQLQPKSKAWAMVANASSMFGKQKILLFTHNLEVCLFVFDLIVYMLSFIR